MNRRAIHLTTVGAVFAALLGFYHTVPNALNAENATTTATRKYIKWDSIPDLADSVSYVSRFDVEAAARIGDGMIDAAETLLSS